MRALAADREALPVTQPAIAGEVHQPLDVHRGLAAQIALHRVIGVDRFADVQDFLIAQVLNTAFRRDLQLLGDFLGLGPPNAVDVGKRDLNALVGGDVDPGNTCHKCIRS